tara:strand:- start:903 stop:1055 length:153 start_codon:yes stop_codon:yes gene_type:complete
MAQKFAAKKVPNKNVKWIYSFSDRKVNVVGTVKDVDKVKLTDPNTRISEK